MTEIIKAQRSTTRIAEIGLEVFKLPKGSYCLSQTQVTQPIHKPANSILHFFNSQACKPLRDKGLAFYRVTAKEAAAGFIVAVPSEVVRRYWSKQAYSGNVYAQALVDALLEESIERKCALAIGDLLEQKVWHFTE